MADTENSTPEPTETGTTAVEGSTTQSQEPSYSDAEQRAIAQGWVPKDQYSGNGKWRSAEEFLDRGELFSKIDEVTRRNRALESTIQETRQHLKKVRETEYNRALTELTARKKAALADGDLVAADDINDQIQNTRVEAAREIQKMNQAPQPQEAAPAPQFVAWANRNAWYQSDKIMKAAADTIADELVANGEKNPTRVLEEVEKRVKAEFPHKFTNPNRSKAGSVESSGRASSGKGSDSFQLTPEETQVMNKLVRHNVMTKDEYIADIKASRGA